MSIPWGPALDAEVAYRHQQARNDFHRWSWRRKPAHHHPVVAATHHIPAQQPQAQRVPAPLIPIRPRPVDAQRPSAHAA